ncbi:MAG: T9SS type A sorting domain-containing protein [Bacteroidetes bacterium]|nr:T9SS type A sorting domain-containing protein [Bacteroidota bacterium]MBU1114177.1 T9SS type A sorting domain-containing protein [Bacteroidota bacterium]MBU1797400.1 T9SS type A sorting domain-containing protein [Bacteroidota bacterium]
MNNKILLFLFLLLSTSFSQVADNYFPQQTGYKWYYEITPLDSVNKPMTSFTTVRIDSFVVEDSFYGKMSNLAVSKSGTINTINYLPYFDSLFVNIESSVISKHLSFLGKIDTNIISDPEFIKYMNEIEGWYPIYQFSDGVKRQYTLFQKDTTITFDSTQFPIRIEFYGKQESDETITSEIGEFVCKKFVISFQLSYLLTVYPFPTVPIPLLTIPDTVWIAPERWIVQEITPSIVLDLTKVGGDIYSVPGYQKMSISEIKTDVDENKVLLSEYNLEQNYPNPFNPSTTVSYNIPENSKVKIEIYNALGQKIDELVNSNQNGGKYSVTWNATGLTSGIYFAKLNATSLKTSETFFEVKKLLLMK